MGAAKEQIVAPSVGPGPVIAMCGTYNYKSISTAGNARHVHYGTCDEAYISEHDWLLEVFDDPGLIEVKPHQLVNGYCYHQHHSEEPIGRWGVASKGHRPVCPEVIWDEL